MTLNVDEWRLVDTLVGQQAHKTERMELQSLPRLLEGVRHFVDAGASYGPFTWAAHFALRDAKITAIDANATLCEHLETAAKTCMSKHTRGDNIEVLNYAVSNSNGTATFLVNSVDYSTSHIAPTEHGGTYTAGHDCMVPVTVPVRTLDTLFGTCPPDFVKLDVEGFEWRALDGARQILSGRRTRFLVEIHPWGDVDISKTPRHIFEIFRTYGYDVNRINHHWLFFPSRFGLGSRVRSDFYAFCTERPWVRTLARRFLSFGR